MCGRIPGIIEWQIPRIGGVLRNAEETGHEVRRCHSNAVPPKNSFIELYCHPGLVCLRFGPVMQWYLQSHRLTTHGFMYTQIYAVIVIRFLPTDHS